MLRTLPRVQIMHQLTVEHKRPAIPTRLPGPGRLVGFEDYVALMNQCWADDPQSRPSIGAVADRLESLAAQQPPDTASRGPF